MVEVVLTALHPKAAGGIQGRSDDLLEVLVVAPCPVEYVGPQVFLLYFLHGLTLVALRVELDPVEESLHVTVDLFLTVILLDPLLRGLPVLREDGISLAFQLGSVVTGHPLVELGTLLALPAVLALGTVEAIQLLELAGLHALSCLHCDLVFGGVPVTLGLVFVVDAHFELLPFVLALHNARP